MATTQIKELIDGGPTTLGGDESLSLDSLLVIETAVGITRKVSLRQVLGFLGLNVGTHAEIDLVIGSQQTPMMAFITDGRKSNHVEGTDMGTFAEGAGLGTGLLAQYQSNNDPEGVDLGTNVTV